MRTGTAYKGHYALTDMHAREETDLTPSEIIGDHGETDTRLEDFGWNASWKESILAWRAELGAWLFSFGCTVAIFLVLNRYNGQATPEWHYGLTLNTLTALLVTIARVSLSVPIVEGISQLKWLWYTSHEPRSMMDFQHFDNASRGFLGCIFFLARPRYL